jgi:hypothetical protein
MINRKDLTPQMVALAVYSIIRLFPENHQQQLWVSSTFTTLGELLESDEGARTADSIYSCGTTACVAGWAHIIAGDNDTVLSDHSDTVFRSATKLLGITEPNADWLFSAYRSKEDIIEALEFIIQGKDITPLAYGLYPVEDAYVFEGDPPF